MLDAIGASLAGTVLGWLVADKFGSRPGWRSIAYAIAAVGGFAALSVASSPTAGVAVLLGGLAGLFVNTSVKRQLRGD
jgi:hypothetical protein